MNKLISLYKQTFGIEPDRIEAINTGSASDRKYFRLEGAQRVIGMIGTSVKENEAFIYLTEEFVRQSLPVPQLIAVSDNHMAYLQTDVGEQSLYDMIAKYGPENQETERLLHQVMALLPRFQRVADTGLDTSKFYPRPAMDQRAAMWDLNYFKYSFLKSTGLSIDEDLLEEDMLTLAAMVTKNPDRTLMLRDFQSRNIMLDQQNLPSVIDYQGARMGDGLYDVASFAWQARAGFSDELRRRLVATYRSAAEAIDGKSVDDFDKRLNMMVVFRTLQVLGAYGFRGYVEHKAQFMVAIPQAIANLREIITKADFTSMPYLEKILTQMTELPQFALSTRDDDGRLTVTVMSFSYKKGIPLDPSGNGGGFVFDCRAMHNPGRYDQFKPLTGLDQPVIDFLEQQGEIQPFLAHCYGLVDPAIECYTRRGFTNLMVCFGCTGGRHRSVYGAEHMAQHIAETYGVTVRLIHREQNIDRRL